MARTRQLKPDFFLHETLALRSPLARLLFEGLWVLADREGRLEDRPARIKAQIFPYHEADMSALLSELDGEFIDRYAVSGSHYIEILNFKKHQHIHPDEKISVIPKNQGIPGDFKTRSEIMPFSSSPSSSTSPSPTPKQIAPSPTVSEPAILEFPTVGSGPKVWGLTVAKIKEYEGSYPGVDVLSECRKALQWCRDTPAKRKTPKGMPAFLSRWLSRQQDAGRNYGASRPGVLGRVVGAAAPVAGKFDKFDNPNGNKNGF